MAKQTRTISEKQIKIIAVVVIVIIIVGILIWGIIPGKIYDVSEILNNPNEFDGKGVNVTGLVTGWTFSTDLPTLNPYQTDQGDIDA